jgi:hypothetical protein
VNPAVDKRNPRRPSSRSALLLNIFRFFNIDYELDIGFLLWRVFLKRVDSWRSDREN